jgi:hypothetical protein
MQEIYLECEDDSDDIDVYFSIDPVCTDIPYSGGISIFYSSMIILVGKDTPSGIYTIHTEAICYDIGRVNGFSDEVTIEFKVGV